MSEQKKLYKIAAVKFGGLAAGGTEKWFQTIVANLPKDKFHVDYFYCDAAPYIGSDFRHPDTDPNRKKYLEDAGINLVKFKVGLKNIRVPTHDWVTTNFWTKFNESDYDVVISARAGHAEYPFTKINNTPVVDFVTLPGMAERKENTKAVVHISKFQADSWVSAGGEASKLEIIPAFSELSPPAVKSNLREMFDIPETDFVFGFHQRDDDGIYSSVPLDAYAKIETDDTCFLLMGGSKLYTEQADRLGLKNFVQLDFSADQDKLFQFLNTLNLYAHGRKDGETFGMSISEAMSVGLPIVSHTAPNMGHLETIGNAGLISGNVDQYVQNLELLMKDKELYKLLSTRAKQRFETELSLEANMKKITDLLLKVASSKELDGMIGDDFWETDWK
ncbi:MAG: glycosyltransferase family 4 protein [Candidatus Paceibacterota bacterium]|jgi:glycosyltransferase involved in cell wall biosynthesis